MEVRGKGDFFFHIFSNYNAQIRNDLAIGIHKKNKRPTLSEYFK